MKTDKRKRTRATGAKCPSVQTVTLAGKRYVIMPEADYWQLVEERPLPRPDSKGNYPALETMRALIARDIVHARRRLGLSQAELARRAGVRVETVNRIEQAKHAPSVATLDKLDHALRAAETKDQ